jgi:excisionase family DNA binding protein
MGQISVREAAHRLGVGERRIRQRIAEGSLPAEWVGRQWVIDERSLGPLDDRRNPGRPLAARSAWAVIAAASAAVDAAAPRPRRPDAARWLDGLAADERYRARKRMRNLLGHASDAVGEGAAAEAEVAEAAAQIRVLLGGRAERVLLRASPRDLADLRDDDRMSIAGLSSPSSGIVSGDVVEGYLEAEHVAPVIGDYLLDPVPHEDEANVVLHVVAGDVVSEVPALWRDAGALSILVAADLAELRRPREQARAVELMAALRDGAPAREDGRE